MIWVLIIPKLDVGENKMNIDITRPTCMEVDINNLLFNINSIKEKVGRNVK